MKSFNPRERYFSGKRRTHLLRHASASSASGCGGSNMLRFNIRKINVHSELFNRDNRWLITGQIFTLQNAR